MSQAKTIFVTLLLFLPMGACETAEAHCVSQIVQIFFQKFRARPWDPQVLDEPAFNMADSNPGESARKKALTRLAQLNERRPRLFEEGEYGAFIRIVNTTTTALFDPHAQEVTYGKPNASVHDILSKVFQLRKMELDNELVAQNQFLMPPIRRATQYVIAHSRKAVVSAVVFVLVVNLTELGLGSVRQGLFGILSWGIGGHHRPTSDFTAVTLRYNSQFTFNEQYGLARLNNARIRLNLISSIIKDSRSLPEDPLKNCRDDLMAFASEFPDLIDPDGPPVAQVIRDRYHRLETLLKQASAETTTNNSSAVVAPK